MCQFLKLYAPQAKQKFSAAQELQLAATTHAVLRVQIQKSPHCTIKMASCPGAFAHCAPSQRVEEQPPLAQAVFGRCELGGLVAVQCVGGGYPSSPDPYSPDFDDDEGFGGHFRGWT